MTTVAEVDPAKEIVLDVMVALDRLDAVRRDLADCSDVPALARLLVGCQELMLNLGSVLDSAEADIASALKAIGEKRVTIEGVGVVSRKPRYSDSYDSSALFRLLIDYALIDHPDEAVRNRLLSTLAKALPLTASLQWRDNALKELGLDLDEFKTRSYGRDRIEVR